MARPRQLQAEISAALAAGTPHPEATVADWKGRIADIQRSARTLSGTEARAQLQRQLDAASDGLRAAQKVAAHAPTFVTGTNLFALKEMVLEHGGPEFPRRVPAVHAPHLRRTVQAGLVEVVGNKARLTAAGREAVADALVKDIGERAGYEPWNTPRERSWLKLAHLEAVLAKLRG